MEEIALRAQGLTKTFGEGDVQVRAVRDVDFGVGRGEVVLIMGPSGSGKTTLLSMIGAMLRPTSGSVMVDGVDLATLPERNLPKFRANTFGFIFQDFNLLSALSASENVEYVLNLGGSTGSEARRKAADLLERFGLGARLNFRPDKLSGGEKQRVAIARALANDPAVILADEPTANLDSKIGHEIAKLLKKAAEEERRSVVIVSHDARLRDIADRILWLEDGAFQAMSDMATDPVCGMAVEREGSSHLRTNGQTFYFCSDGCRREFVNDPAGFLKTPAGAASARG